MNQREIIMKRNTIFECEKATTIVALSIFSPMIDGTGRLENVQYKRVKSDFFSSIRRDNFKHKSIRSIYKRK